MEQKRTISSELPTFGFGERIREERQRLKLNQREFAERAGVSRASQAHYELAQRVPDLVYLGALAADVDILYVVTGERSAKGIAQAIDARLIEPIIAAIDTWAVENKKALTHKVRAELLALFLQQAVSTGKFERDWIRKTLQLVK
jgi:transcriptional regulator with XRE-family HTH domain